MLDDEELAHVYKDLRPLLFSIAYRMLGSVGDAEDIVQESFVRYQRALADGLVAESPKAYLSAVATRLSVDLLKSARVRRESYVGMWLPEPLLVDPMPDAAARAELADSLSMAFLVVLETLSPVERAVFLLREVFDFSYDEIADMVGKTSSNCRQLLVRAKKHVDERRPRFEASREQRAVLADKFFAAVQIGDVAGLQELLAADVTFVGDGGGKAPATARVVAGVDNVSRLLLSLTQQAAEFGFTMRLVEVNGQPGALFLTPDGLISNVVSLDIVDGQVQAIHGVVNPDKLRHLGQVADLRALVHRLREHGESNPA
ncbi:MAG: RNA polymerase sigma-70 factor [Acidothermaceae bacterium]